MEKIWRDRKRIWCGLPWTFTIYSFSEDRFFVESGFFTKKEDEVRLYRILDISMTRSLFQRMFGLTTLHVNSSDKSLGNFDIKNIKNGPEVKEKLSELVEKVRTEKRVVSREYMVEHDDDEDDSIF